VQHVRAGVAFLGGQRAMAQSGVLLAVRGKLHLFDAESERFELRVSECELQLEKEGSGFFVRLYKMPPARRPRTRASAAAGEDEAEPLPTMVLEQLVADDMRHQFFSGELSFVWVLPASEGPNETESGAQCFSFRLDSAGDFVQLRNQFSVCLYESKMDFSKLDEGDQQWVRGSERDDMDLSADETEHAAASEPQRYTKLGDENRGVRVGGEAQDSDDDNALNSQLAVGYSNARAFVVRGNRMGVFKNTDEGLDYQTLLKFKPQRGAAFDPSQILLHQQDRSMLVLDPSDPNKVSHHRSLGLDSHGHNLCTNPPKCLQKITARTVLRRICV